MDRAADEESGRNSHAEDGTYCSRPLDHHRNENGEIENNQELLSMVRSSSALSVSDDPDDSQSNSSTGRTHNNLTRQEIWNLTFCLLAWACTVSNVTLVVGTSNVVILSIGADARLAPLPLAAFFMGSAFISVGVTEPLFRTMGRKVGFLTGIAIGLVGSLLGATSLWIESPALNIVATAFFGAATGIGFFLRFAAVELVPPEWAARAVTLVVSGGLLAAFVGPETSSATHGIFGDGENMAFMGVFLMTAIFGAVNIFCILLVQFPPPAKPCDVQQDDSADNKLSRSQINEVKSIGGRFLTFISMYQSLFQTRSFLIPLLIATLSWEIMALPMSLLRVTMTELGFTARQSLTVIELHFVGMYGPGFVTGPLIQRLGVRAVCLAGALVSAMAVIFALTAESASDGSIALWYLCMIAIGVGWNFSFTGATVWLTKVVGATEFTKTQIQSANDSLMFLVAGLWIFSAGYIYNSGGGKLGGWKTLNFVVVGLIGLYFIVIGIDFFLETKESETDTTKKNVSEPIQTEASSKINQIQVDSRDADSDHSIEIDLEQTKKPGFQDVSSPARSIVAGSYRFND